MKLSTSFIVSEIMHRGNFNTSCATCEDYHVIESNPRSAGAQEHASSFAERSGGGGCVRNCFPGQLPGVIWRHGLTEMSFAFVSYDTGISRDEVNDAFGISFTSNWFLHKTAQISDGFPRNVLCEHSCTFWTFNVHGKYSPLAFATMGQTMTFNFRLEKWRTSTNGKKRGFRW